MLQRKAGYIDARPLTAELVELSCNARPDHTFGSMLSKNSLFEGHFSDAVRAEPSFQSLEHRFGARVFSRFMSGAPVF